MEDTNQKEDPGTSDKNNKDIESPPAQKPPDNTVDFSSAAGADTQSSQLGPM